MSRQPRPRTATMPCWNSHHWPRDSSQTASGETGAVQSLASLLIEGCAKLKLRGKTLFLFLLLSEDPL